MRATLPIARACRAMAALHGKSPAPGVLLSISIMRVGSGLAEVTVRMVAGCTHLTHLTGEGEGTDYRIAEHISQGELDVWLVS